MLWQGLQRDVQYSVTAVEMVICSAYWKESLAEREQPEDVPPPWEGGSGTLSCWGITLSIPNVLSCGAVAFPAP